MGRILHTFRWAALLTAAQLVAAAGGAQDEDPGRKEEWRSRRLEKLEDVERQTTSRTERAFLWLEEELGEPVPSTTMVPIEESLQLVNESVGDLPFPDHRDRLFTRVGSIRSGGGLSGGVRLINLGVFQRQIDLDATGNVSIHGYQFHRIRIGKMLPVMAPTALLGPILSQDFDPWFAYVDLRYHDFREEEFFELGGGDTAFEAAEFRHQRRAYSGIFGYRAGRNLIASARLGFSENRISPADEGSEEIPARELLPDSEPSTDFVELAASLRIDFRDVAGNARRGAYIDVAGARFDDTDARKFSFTRLAIEGHGFVPLGSPQRVLAIRGQLSSDQPDAGHRVPFYLQRTLGGNETLRGFSDYRFRAENLMHMAVEYRFSPAIYWGLSLFWDTGKAFRSFEDGFDLSGLENSFGIGTSLQTPDSTLVRFQVAWSREGTRFHFAVGKVF